MRPTLVLALGALAVAPAAADARIVVDRSIAGVELDMTSREVREVLGTPTRVVFPRDDIQGTVKRMDYGLTRVFLGRSSDKVFSIQTTSRKQRTSRDVGVGSTERAVRKHVRGVRCETFGDFRTCHTGQLLAGRKVTDFVFGRGTRVTRVTLAYVID